MLLKYIGRQIKSTQEANGSANYLFCSYQEPKIRNDARRLKRFEGYLSGGISGCFVVNICEGKHFLPRMRARQMQLLLVPRWML